MQKYVNIVDLVRSSLKELRDIQKEFPEYARYMLRSLFQSFVFQSLSMYLLLNLLFEPDPYSNEYLLAKIDLETAENGPLQV